MEQRLLSEEHLNVVGKYKEIVERLRAVEKMEAERDKNMEEKEKVIVEMKSEYQKELNKQE